MVLSSKDFKYNQDIFPAVKDTMGHFLNFHYFESITVITINKRDFLLFILPKCYVVTFVCK